MGTLVAGRYEVLGSLACGGMADVLAARDHRLQRDVALKVARVTATTDRARFDAEIRLLASLQHPHLVRMFDAGVHEGDAFLVLELADGPTLGALLSSGPVPEERLHALGRDLAGALAHVHDKGIVHRDVKPANVLTAADGRWLLADFGIARLLDATGLTATGTAVGTPAYLAPEQVTGASATPATDVYALGLVLLEAATGRPAYPGDWREAARARLTQDPDVAAAPAPWPALLAAMTASDPAERPTAAQVHAWLAADGVVDPTPPPLAGRPGSAAFGVVAATTGLRPVDGVPDPTAETAAPVAPYSVGATGPAQEAEPAGPSGVGPLAPVGVAAAGRAPSVDRADAADVAAPDPTERRPGHRRLAAVAAAVLLLVVIGVTLLRAGADDATASPAEPAPSSSTVPSTTVPVTEPMTAPTVAVAVVETVPTTAPSTTTTSVATTVPPTTTTLVAMPVAGNVASGACPTSTPTTVAEPVTAPADSSTEGAAAPAPAPQPEPATADC